MDAGYHRSAIRRELKDRREKRQLVAKTVTKALTHLDAVVRAVNHGDNVSDAIDREALDIPISEIPTTMLPKRAHPKIAGGHSVVKTQMANEAYEADLKSRPTTATLPAANGGSHRPLISPDQPLPVSWDAQGRKNDNAHVTSKLLYVRGAAEAPPIYKPAEENPRKQIAEARRIRQEQSVQPREKKLAPFEYKPTVTKVSPEHIPRVFSLVPPPTAERPKSATTIHGKPFRQGEAPPKRKSSTTARPR